MPKDYPRGIIKSPEEQYLDTLTKRNIAIKRLDFEGKLRNILVAYDIIDNSIEIVTIHVISSKEIENKIQAGRWKTYEKN